MPETPPPLQSLTAELQLALRNRMETFLAQLIRDNSRSVFFREAPLLSAFRDRISAGRKSDEETVVNGDAGPLRTVHSRDLLQSFYETIPLSLYDAYEPFVSRFLDQSPCAADSVRDLFSPGFPDFIAQTSGTSGATVKSFPRYPIPKNNGYIPEDVRFCAFSSLRVSRSVKVVDGEGDLQKELPVTIIGSGLMRKRMGVALRDDEKVMTQTPPFSSIPYAVWYIPTFMGNLFMTMFFAVMDPSLVFMRASYTTIFYDAVLILEEHWDIVVDAVEKGTVPDVYDLDYCKPYLEAQVKPNPHRAAELRLIEKGTEGWLKRIWPELKIVRASNSGSYAAFASKIRHHVGPSVDIQSYSYGASECMIGYGYDSANDHNLYRVCSDTHYEYLDITEPESTPALRQAWEIQTGKQYELVVTTTHGLWRYQIGDVIEIGGFDPNNGRPLVRFVERRGVGFRIHAEFVTEKLIQDAIHSVHNSLGRVSEFVAELDDRNFPRNYGYFVELDGELGPDPDSAPRKVQEVLLTNPGYKKFTDYGRIGVPTIRIVEPRTFRAYREWRLEVTGCPMGQIKVPTTTANVAIKEWLAKKVVLEIGLPPTAPSP